MLAVEVGLHTMTQEQRYSTIDTIKSDTTGTPTYLSNKFDADALMLQSLSSLLHIEIDLECKRQRFDK